MKRNSIAERLFDVFPTGTYALHALFRVLEIVETPDVRTAAIECLAAPRLLVNPAFVEKHVATPEHLLMLVMHELHHLILGHTRLYPRVTRLDNLVFDAVVNAFLCHLFPDDAYVSLLTTLYDERRFPECFLRPAPGWKPARGPSPLPTALEKGAPRLAELHRALYSPHGVTYGELRDGLAEAIPPPLVVFVVTPSSADEAAACSDGMAVSPVENGLLGDHRPEDHESSSGGNLEGRSPVLFEVVREIVERWPQPPQAIHGRSLSSLLQGRRIAVPPPSNGDRLVRLLSLLGSEDQGARTRRADFRHEQIVSPIPLPSRRGTVLRALGTTPMLHPATLEVSRRRPQGARVHVYVDVSGSVAPLIGALYSAVLRAQRWVHPVVHLFSTRVENVTLAQLRRGACRTTNGTSIECVAEHIRANGVQRAAIITDGWVGRPRGRDRDTLRAVRLGIALTPDGSNDRDLAGVVDHVVHLSVSEPRR